MEATYITRISLDCRLGVPFARFHQVLFHTVPNGDTPTNSDKLIQLLLRVHARLSTSPDSLVKGVHPTATMVNFGETFGRYFGVDDLLIISRKVARICGACSEVRSASMSVSAQLQEPEELTP